MSDRFTLPRFLVSLGRFPLMLALLVAGIGIGAFAYAGFAQNGGVLYACYNNTNGQMRFTDACKENESLISWNQVGPQGLQGPPGEDGTDGVDGKDGIDGQDGADGRDGVDGQDGADGRDGIDGTNGVDGEDGANGVSGWEQKTNTWSLDPGEVVGLSVACSDGKKVLGGGGSADGIGLAMHESEPLGDRGWTIQVSNQGDDTLTVAVFAICATVE